MKLIRRADGLSTASLHERYDAVAESVYDGRDLTPINESQRRVKLRKLRASDLVVYEGENRHGSHLPADAAVVSGVTLCSPTEAV